MAVVLSATASSALPDVTDHQLIIREVFSSITHESLGVAVQGKVTYNSGAILLMALQEW